MEKREKSEKLKRLFLYNTFSSLSSMLKCAGISKITLGEHKYVQNKSRYDFFFF